jgi:hypothetical protein
LEHPKRNAGTRKRRRRKEVRKAGSIESDIFIPKFNTSYFQSKVASDCQMAVPRAAAVQELLRQQEARLESLYFSPQNDGPDAFGIVEMPVGGADALGVIALAGRTGGITLTARRIFTPEELDKLAAKSKSIPVPGK